MACLSFKLLAPVLFLAGVSAAVSLTATLEADLRATARDPGNHEAGIHLLAGSLKSVFADAEGDRLILFANLEAMDNLSEVMLHEVYGRYKGPLGKWNLTLGRYAPPFGLLATYVSTRFLFRTPETATLGMDADNGLMLSGVLPSFDYALSLSQGIDGHGVFDFPGPGHITGRIAFPLGEGEDYSLGLSGAFGSAPGGHHPGDFSEHGLGAVDFTGYLGAAILRVEGTAGLSDHEKLISLWSGFDYALFPKLEVNLGAGYISHGTIDQGSGFAGVTLRPRWFVLRGGYRILNDGGPIHEATLQLYRQFVHTH